MSFLQEYCPEQVTVQSPFRGQWRVLSLHALRPEHVTVQLRFVGQLIARRQQDVKRLQPIALRSEIHGI